MRQQAPFIGFDFETVWTMGGNPDYPYPKLIGMYHGGGSDAGGFASGSGTESDPYIIKTAPQLVYFA
ncbi:hypothetical protein ACP3W2_28040, partial [Salmonella enterica]|uniref:hypothetical protein n=1 Tax=Salmonella enterica TaxID=28901 RepID=UPI003CF24C9B